MSTSASTITPPEGREASPDRSTLVTSLRPRRPGAIGSPSASRMRAPRARRIPAPPSVEALDPRPTMMRDTPARSASTIASPTPVVSASQGRRRPCSASIPEVDANSMTAVVPPHAPSGGTSTHALSWRSPSAPVARIGRSVAPGIAAKNASSVPSPPSAIGRTITSSSGLARPQPRANASAARRADTDPLKLSGAITMRRFTVTPRVYGSSRAR